MSQAFPSINFAYSEPLAKAFRTWTWVIIKIKNPVTQGDHTAGHNRYEKGRVDKSRS